MPRNNERRTFPTFSVSHTPHLSIASIYFLYLSIIIFMFPLATYIQRKKSPPPPLSLSVFISLTTNLPPIFLFYLFFFPSARPSLTPNPISLFSSFLHIIFEIPFFFGRVFDLMSRKSKGVVLYDEGAKARFKHQTLLQDYHDLHKDIDVTRNKLGAAKQRKLTLAAEVRFLRERYASLVRANSMNSLEKEKVVLQPNSHKQKMKQVKEQSYSRNEASEWGLTLVVVPKPKPKKKNHILKDVTQHHKKILPGGKTNYREEVLAQFTAPVLDLNQKARMHGVNDSALKNLILPFDLNQDSSIPSGNEGSLPSQALIFDLNEISTGDEDFQSNAEGTNLDEVKKSSIRGLNDDMQNDLKLSIICRNAGEGPSRIGKRKISWQDPVALRV